jgi:hypothetical protein
MDRSSMFGASSISARRFTSTGIIGLLFTSSLVACSSAVPTDGLAESDVATIDQSVTGPTRYVRLRASTERTEPKSAHHLANGVDTISRARARQ